MVKVLSSFVRGPLEPHITGFAEELLRQGYTRTSAAAHNALSNAQPPHRLPEQSRGSRSLDQSQFP